MSNKLIYMYVRGSSFSLFLSQLANDQRFKMTTRQLSVAKTRRSVIRAIKKSPQSLKWVDFWEQYESYVQKSCSRKLRRPEDVQDAVSMVKVQLFTSIKNYDHKKGSFHNWLKTVAIRRAIDLARQVIKANDRELGPHTKLVKRTLRQGARHGDPLEWKPHTELIDDLQSPNSGPRTVVKRKEERELAVSTAVERTKGRVSAIQWQIFDCSWRRDWDNERVCKTLGVDENQVYIARSRVRKVYEEELMAVAEALR